MIVLFLYSNISFYVLVAVGVKKWPNVTVVSNKMKHIYKTLETTSIIDVIFI